MTLNFVNAYAVMSFKVLVLWKGGYSVSADTLVTESVKYYCCYLLWTVLDLRVVLFCLFCKHSLICIRIHLSPC
jgi:hypothetical protein